MTAGHILRNDFIDGFSIREDVLGIDLVLRAAESQCL